ncbi:DNA primase [Candidatus Peregrinibacteria bacterium CG11_big_fil_rev_8_21_14_0_20_46_8]|nr:MAG: DNA primase [Candidatus Peregrinibacteria bacterium CG11_big_fil_rev_8_21_14_0_20_46_8]
MDAVAEIKSRLPIDQLVSRYVKLKKAGRYFKGLCPFHQERTPSFVVSPEKEMAYCFGCRKGGDHFTFVQELEGLEFKDALKFLADIANVTLPEQNTHLQQERRSERDRLYELHEEAARFFTEQLAVSPQTRGAAAHARTYIEQRELDPETVRFARLGYAPGEARGHSDELYKHLLNSGFSKDEIITSGLAFPLDATGGSTCRDRFRDRLIFPIRDAQGRVCAFGARALEDGDEPKYLNSPESPIFHKGSVLYGFGEARNDIRESKSAILAEGYMDVLAIRQAGITNVVATCGTACTEEHLRQLKRTAQKLILAFDKDSAGRNAAKRTIELGLATEMPMTVANWPGDVKDPDECLKKDPDAFLTAIEKSTPAQIFIFNWLEESFDLQDSVQRATALKEILPLLTAIKSTIERDTWIQRGAASLQVSPSSLYDELKRHLGKQRMPLQQRPAIQEENRQNGLSEEEYLLGLLLTYKELSSIANHIVDETFFRDNELQDIYRSLASEYNPILEDSAQKKAEMLVLFIETMNTGLSWEELQGELKRTLRRMIQNRFTRQKRELVTKMKRVSPEEKNQLLEQYTSLINEETEALRSDTLL